MEDRKGKGIMEYKNNDWDRPPESARRTAIREVAWVPAPYGREDGSNRSAGAFGALQIRENPGQNAPRSAPVANEPRGRPTGQQPGVVLGAGGSIPGHGLQLQGQAPRGSGIRPPPPMVCPVCRYSFFFDNTICVYCACAAAAAAENASTGHQGGEAPAFQNLSPGLQRPPQAHWGPLPVPDDRRCPACCFFPGRIADRPWRHVCRCDVCRFFFARVCLVCVFQHAAVVPERTGLPPQPHHQHPLGLNNTRNLLHPSVPACSSSSSSGTWQNKLPPAARRRARWGARRVRRRSTRASRPSATTAGASSAPRRPARGSPLPSPCTRTAGARLASTHGRRRCSSHGRMSACAIPASTSTPSCARCAPTSRPAHRKGPFDSV
ncbi:hypothetical protein SEVIR_9G211355v4 [Setaria viridis]